jgi:cellulose synthase/poly-beta-1,6-N-acetylglucosamine synthase-like glycosyltransferase
MVEFIFYFAIAMLVYVYFGYPCCALVLGKIKRNSPIKNETYSPSVSIVIAAFNEENNIAQTIENKLDLNYAHDRMEILVVSDGSTDRTDEIVAGYAAKGVQLLIQDSRQGKTAALNAALLRASGEIVVFSDANSIYERDALIKLVRNFSDKSVGYVTGHMIYISEDGTVVGDGCSAFMKYENFIRKHEAEFGSVVGVDGGVDAVRRKLYVPMNPDQLPDFVLPLQIVKQGYRVVYEPEALLKEESLKDSPDEYRMRVRVALRALWAMWDMRELLFSRDKVLFSWQLWSHKVLRYLGFFFMFSAFVANAFLWQQGLAYKILFIAQILFYTMALFPFLGRSCLSQLRIINFANYFILVNIAFLHAAVNFICGRKIVIWAPRKG